MLFLAASPIVVAFLCSIPAIFASPTLSSRQDVSNTTVVLDYGTFLGAYSLDYNLTYYRKIPFAASTAGENRFRAPQPPLPIDTDTYDTNKSFDLCPQRTINGSEDCLYLGVYSRPWAPGKKQALRPVLLSFYNGGFIGTSETWNIPPAGYPVLNVSSQNDYVIVYANYRTSVFGFLASSKVADREDVDLNCGLLDQRAAMEWVQKYIHHFGGDKSNVTIWGQSASAGSVAAQAIATGNQGKNLFSRVIANDPTIVKTYRYDSDWAETLYNHTLEYVGCADSEDEIGCLKDADIQKLRESAVALVRDPRYLVATFTFAPVIDIGFLTKSLTEVVRSGALNAQAVMTSYNLLEGNMFVPGGLANATTGVDGFNSSTASFDEWLRRYLPGFTSKDLESVKELYPERGIAEETEWNTTIARAGMIYRDTVFACPAYWLSSKAEKGYLVQSGLSPALHVTDAKYWNLVNPVQQTDRLTYQGYVGAMASFIQTGDPNAHKITNDSVPGVPDLKQNKQFLVTGAGLGQGEVKMLGKRCSFWESVGDRIPN